MRITAFGGLTGEALHRGRLGCACAITRGEVSLVRVPRPSFLVGVASYRHTHQKGVSVKAGLWTLDWTVDWTHGLKFGLGFGLTRRSMTTISYPILYEVHVHVGEKAM